MRTIEETEVYPGGNSIDMGMRRNLLRKFSKWGLASLNAASSDSPT